MILYLIGFKINILFADPICFNQIQYKSNPSLTEMSENSIHLTKYNF